MKFHLHRLKCFQGHQKIFITKFWIETLFLLFSSIITFDLEMILISFTIYFPSTRDFDRYRSLLMLFLISGYLFRTYVVNTFLRFCSLIISSLICYLLSSLFRKYFAIHIVLLARLAERMISLMAVKVESLIPRTMILSPMMNRERK